MRFRLVAQVVTPREVWRSHVIAHPLDAEAAEVGLWPVHPRTLCNRRGGAALEDCQRAQCDRCTVAARLLASTCRAFDLWHARIDRAARMKEDEMASSAAVPRGLLGEPDGLLHPDRLTVADRARQDPALLAEEAARRRSPSDAVRAFQAASDKALGRK